MMMARGGSWWIYIMIFFVVQGVLSTVGFAASSLLGFPAAWITFLNLPIAGAVIYLFYKGYPITAYGLLACALVGLISVLALLRAVTIEKPTAPSPPKWNALLKPTTKTPTSPMCCWATPTMTIF